MLIKTSSPFLIIKPDLARVGVNVEGCTDSGVVAVEGLAHSVGHTVHCGNESTDQVLLEGKGACNIDFVLNKGVVIDLKSEGR